MIADHQFFATCPKGLESLLLDELKALGAEDVRETIAGVYFSGDIKKAYEVCLWSRLANKILMPLVQERVDTADDLYRVARAIDWTQYLKPNGSLLVDFSGESRSIRNTQFGAVKVKDAIVDCFRDETGERPDVAKRDPDLRVNARLARGKVTIGLDLCGESLHRRGYRKSQGEAPLKENLAAAILMRAGWGTNGAQEALLDPMCGSGTFLIEAAMISADIAPGLMRTGFAFERLLNHDANLWAELREQAQSRKRKGLERELPEIRGYDANLAVIRAAEENITRAGFDDWLRVTRKELREFVKPTHKTLEHGIIVTNPPYGERLGEIEAMKSLYRHLGERLREEFTGWRAAIFTGNPELGKQMGVRAQKKYKLFNGTIASELLLFSIEPQYTVQNRAADVDAPDADSSAPVALSNGAQMLVNRLQKNSKKLKSWRKRSGASCYRLYDADMPEYACAIDVYEGVVDGTNTIRRQVHVQEYQPPRSIDEKAAAERFQEIQAAVPIALDVSPESVSFKQRRRNRGVMQYEKLHEKPMGELLQVQEGNAKLLINLWQYLDSGLFLDHRPLRLRIASETKGKRFLNLFCYTAAASVQAALGGARFTLSVDMSQTYLNWASRNLAMNGLSESRNRLEKADCVKWLKEADQKFDLIMLDPPSFSNSKKMIDVLDVQRDHVSLIDQSMVLLDEGGVLYFSNNLRSFKLDSDALSRYQVEDISAATIDDDFSRNQKIHQCWRITRG
ncbi:bifunctional 23S rRNA (guanine(2069)-N(7))-methyltransferase RlmK/23S rRNA (guanine(2445)-N(2))-methyltransferase RlmL [Gilvimarinus agarilyticus]|uniref:bifunctional 23S rRNA (guanine(2069)-N(7))-methyltransferase RlmK/23S rRNA (guanine(2445)-N(2))-methyltransferase RlmL n=1 Tax=Gilvimarinus agarilyticus TaxID=679259 RepID=UPI0005A0E801|nr:bifunctional 23S rRNA (guanine(2069)-N(7))-methyltransferase RlmK/23S rRNA (guanine(2445)-N(2))-methyltransferase RlmL [Gilvimarinus agarilyticus]